MIAEGSHNEDIYIIREGEFTGSQKYHEVGKINMDKLNDTVNDFLSGEEGKRSVRGVFNKKI